MTIEQRKKRVDELRAKYHRLRRGRRSLIGIRRAWAKNIDTALSIHLGKLEKAGVYGY